MKSLERRFNQIRTQHPYWSTHLCFAKAVTNQHFTHAIILYWFNKLVDKDDYSTSDKREIIAHLEKLNTSTDEHIK